MTEEPHSVRHQAGSQWYDGEAGLLVRPYGVTGGRPERGREASASI
ncbi:hypothetical protein [Streptomyces flavofungini]